MRSLAVLAASALLLSACVFSSEKPFFAERDGAAPILDGARFLWVEAGESAPEQRVITFCRHGRGYDVLGIGREQERAMPVLIVDVPRTREQDFVVQARIAPDEEDAGVAYVFLWRSGDGLRMISDVRALSDTPSTEEFAAWCRMRSYNECQFASRRDLMRFYRERVHPAFVAPGAGVPEHFVDLRPENDEARRSLR